MELDREDVEQVSEEQVRDRLGDEMDTNWLAAIASCPNTECDGSNSVSTDPGPSFFLHCSNCNSYFKKVR